MTFDDEPVEASRRSTVRPLDVAEAEARLPPWTRELLACLTPRARTAFVLRQTGMSFGQIGRHLGVSKSRASTLNAAAERRMVATAQRAVQLRSVRPMPVPVTTNEVPPRLRASLDLHIDVLDLSVRSYACLHNVGAIRIGDVVKRSELDLLRIKNLGRKSLKEIRTALAYHGLRFGMDVGNWQPPVDPTPADR